MGIQTGSGDRARNADWVEISHHYPILVSYFDKHPLRQCSTSQNKECSGVLQQDARANLPWPTCSPVLNHIEYMCDILGRKIHQSTLPI